MDLRRSEVLMPEELHGKWYWSVIYSADWDSREFGVAIFAPPVKKVPVKGGKPRLLWEQTEKGPSEYGEDLKSWKHRKWCAYLTHEEFMEFLRKSDVAATTSPTMGSIGAPGMGLGCVPAFCFECHDNSCDQNAYVTLDADVPGVLQLLRFLYWQSELAKDFSWADAQPQLLEKYPKTMTLDEDTVRDLLVEAYGDG